MSLIISFARTTAALVAGRKSVTRREWTDRTFNQFANRCGEQVQAWSKSPRAGGRKIGMIQLVSVTKEPTHLIPDSDWEAEGFAYMEEHGIEIGKEQTCRQLWDMWRADPQKETAVIRFDLASLEPGVTEQEFWMVKP